MFKKDITIEEIIVTAIIYMVVFVASVFGVFYIIIKNGFIMWYFVILGLVSLICSIIYLFWWMDLRELPDADDNRKKEIEKNISTYKIISSVVLILFIFVMIFTVYYSIFSIFSIF